MGWLKGLIVACLVMQVSGALAQGIACRAPLKPMLRAELFFGRHVGGRPGVTERQWARFLTRELAPRFPGGLTVIDGRGEWRDSGSEAVMREPAKIVIVVAADDDATRERIEAAAAAYKQRFRQKSVGIVTRPVCAAF